MQNHDTDVAEWIMCACVAMYYFLISSLELTGKRWELSTQTRVIVGTAAKGRILFVFRFWFHALYVESNFISY